MKYAQVILLILLVITIEDGLIFVLYSASPDSKITAEKLIEGNAFVAAVVLYKKQNNCTLREARDACAELRINKEM